MMKKILLLAVLLSPILASGCVHHHYHEPGYSRGGPPPHAPAHGYRHKHYNHDLVFDSGLGVYLVLGRPDYYFWDNRYFRYHDGYWQFAADLDGRWYHDDGHVPAVKLAAEQQAGQPLNSPLAVFKVLRQWKDNFKAA